MGCKSVAWIEPRGHALKESSNIGYLFLVMFGLFAFDTMSAVVNSIWLWRMVKLNMLQEFNRVLKEYWLFMAVKFGTSLPIRACEMGISGSSSRLPRKTLLSYTFEVMLL